MSGDNTTQTIQELRDWFLHNRCPPPRQGEGSLGDRIKNMRTRLDERGAREFSKLLGTDKWRKH